MDGDETTWCDAFLNGESNSLYLKSIGHSVKQFTYFRILWQLVTVVSFGLIFLAKGRYYFNPYYITNRMVNIA